MSAVEIDGFMRKDELIAKLRSFRGDGPNSEWDRMAASDLADYLEQADIPDGVTKNILSDLARYIAEGVEEDAQLSRNDPKRKLPLFSCDADSYTELLPFESNEYLRFMATKKAAELLERITEFPGFGQALQSYWDAQYTALRQAADKFTKKVWQEGLCDIVRKSSSRRLHGQFGKTKLTTNTLCYCAVFSSNKYFRLFFWPAKTLLQIFFFPVPPPAKNRRCLVSAFFMGPQKNKA